ncbi:putative two-component sensor histidine kinase, classical system [Candidatus Terasakiella magnetica]|nr:putative two-component sensor histidine kinase, classical system [Candidatus Terasakiella magnetica]
MTPRSLRGRLILGAGLWLTLALALGGWVLGHAFRDAAERGFILRLEAHLRALAAVVDILPDGTVTVGRPVGEPRFDQPYSGWYWQVSDGTEIPARSRSLWDSALTVATTGTLGAIQTRDLTGPRGERLAVVERDVAFPESAARLHMTIAASRQEVDEEVHRFDLLLLAALAALGLGLIAAVAVQVGYGLSPLKYLAAELDALRQGGGRLGGTYPQEVAPLVAAMNDVLDHDAQLIERARTHVGNLAHGLKTPLAVLRVELSSPSPDPAITTAQIERMTRLVEINLSHARAEASSARAVGLRVPVAVIAEELAAAMRRIHAERRLEIDVLCAPGAVFAGDQDDLAEVLGNLLDNACKWAAQRVRLVARDEILTVEDDGPGLTPEEIEIATRRGARLDETAPGSGLGLAIVSDLTMVTGHRLEFDRSELGGLRVSISPAHKHNCA